MFLTELGVLAATYKHVDYVSCTASKQLKFYNENASKNQRKTPTYMIWAYPVCHTIALKIFGLHKSTLTRYREILQGEYPIFSNGSPFKSPQPHFLSQQD